MEVVASLSQGRTAAAQCGLFTYKSVPVIFEPPCTIGFKTQQEAISDFLISSLDHCKFGSGEIFTHVLPMDNFFVFFFRNVSPQK